MTKAASGAQARREVIVPTNAVYTALAAIAGVIEEPYCVLGEVEMRGLIAAHSRLHRALGLDPDYRYCDGRAWSTRGGELIKGALRVADPPDPTRQHEDCDVERFACETQSSKEGAADGRATS